MFRKKKWAAVKAGEWERDRSIMFAFSSSVLHESEMSEHIMYYYNVCNNASFARVECLVAWSCSSIELIKSLKKTLFFRHRVWKQALALENKRNYKSMKANLIGHAQRKFQRILPIFTAFLSI